MTTDTTAQAVVSPARRRGVLRGIVSRPVGAIALGYLVLLVLGVVLAPWVAPADPLAQDLRHVFAGPSSAHLLGADNLGRDILSRLLWGGRTSLLGAGVATGTMIVIGVPLGVMAGFVGRLADAVVNRVIDVVLAIPNIVALLVVLAIFGQSEVAAMVALGVLGAPGMTRIVRASVVAIRSDLFIAAARVAGLSTPRILVRHILPRVTGPILVRTFLFAGAALLTESGLAYLGLGVQEPEPSWGGMIATAQTYLSDHPGQLVPGGLTIALTVLAFGLVGDAVRDAIGDRSSATRRRHGTAATVTVPGASAAADALLSVRDLTVELPRDRGAVTVVDGVSFEIRPGETVGLVGESGCGKSVTARTVLGLVPGEGRVVAGSVWYDGDDLVAAGERGYRRVRGAEIALISQEPVASLDPNFTVGDQIAEVVRRHRGVSRRRARGEAVEMLRRVRMTDPESVARRYPHELSGGMAQRVGIAAALAVNPRLLIADEPTTALDVTVQADILDLLRDLQEQTGMAILLVTHDWGVISDLTQRTLVMYAGQIVEAGSTGDVIRAPRHPYSAALLASNPHGVTTGGRLPSIAGTVPAPGSWPHGCRFAARCPFATIECRDGPIPLDTVAADRRSRCIHVDRLGAEERVA